MIQYNVSKRKKLVNGMMTGCAFDAINIILKRCPFVANALDLCFDDFIDDGDVDLYLPLEMMHALKLDVALLEDTYTAKSTAIGGDEFNVDTGKALVKKKLIIKHQKALNAAIKRWENAVARDIANVRVGRIGRKDA